MTRKVHQAEVSKANAEANITCKLNILNDWLAKGIPFQQTIDGSTLLDSNDQKLLDFYPTSLRQFKAWDGSQNCQQVRSQLPALLATGNDTLAKRPALEERAKRVIAALRIRAASQVNTTRQSEIKRLIEELQVARTTIDIRNAELREQQRKLRQIEREKNRLHQKVTGDAVEFKRIYESLLAELETHKVMSAQLAAKLAKIMPLKQAGAT